MTANPWDKWFWSDWENDPGLKLCSLAAQGIWMRMLCVMAKSNPKGYLRVADEDCSPEDIASLVGRPIDEVEALLTELEKQKVFSRDRSGCIYNRRMIRSEKKAKTARKNGKSGGNPTLCKTMENPASDNQNSERALSNLSGIKPEAISHKPEASLNGHEENGSHEQLTTIALGEKCLEIFGMPKSQFMSHFGPLNDLRAYPCSDEEILQAAKRIAERPGFSLKGNPIALLAKAGRDEIDKIRNDAARERRQDGGSPEYRTAADIDREKWDRRVRRFQQVDFWVDSWGPKPNEPGCEAPPDILAEFGYGLPTTNSRTRTEVVQ